MSAPDTDTETVGMTDHGVGGGAAAASSPLNARKQCATCGSSFSRLEHLLRHAKTHTREKPFRCTVCGKHFARQDVLGRHFAAHRKDEIAATDAVHARACGQCATSRVRCSKTSPCARCSARNLACTYPESTKPRGRPPTSGEQIACATEITSSTSYEQSVGHESEGDSVSPASVNMNGSTEDALAAVQHSSDTILLTSTDQVIAAVLPEQSGWDQGQPDYEDSRLPLSQSYSSGGVSGPSYGNGVMGQAMDLLSMNWMSPDYSNALDWNGMLEGTNYTNVDPNMATFPFLFHAQAEPSGPWFPLGGQLEGQNKAAEAMPDARRPPSSGLVDHQGSTPGRSTHNSHVTDSTEASCYVDGDESRAPFRGQSTRQRRRRAVHAPGHAPTPSMYSAGQVHGSPLTFDDGPLVTEESYNNMVQQLHHELREASFTLSPINIPPQQRIADLTQLYFDNFHPVFPFLRKNDFATQTRTNWVLLLAVATIGEKFVPRLHRGPISNDLVELLEMVCERLILGVRQDNNKASWTPSLHELEHSQFDIATLQAVTLNLISIVHSGDESLMKRALAERQYLVGGCNGMRLLSPHSNEGSAANDTNYLLGSGVVQRWLRRQSHIRTGMMIWLLDFMIAYEFNSTPLMQLVDASGPLPCHDGIWENPTAEAIADAQSRTVTLIDAVEMLYIEKRMPEQLTEFSANLLIHAILRRSKEVIRQSQTRLASWTPTAEVQSRVSQQKVLDQTWPPSTPLLSKWRNSACDCLDILHWHANGKAASAAGYEHPTIIYLHLSRLVLLTPMEPIQTLASMANTPAGTPNARYMEARSQVLRWAIHDAFKARLSIIHAGAVFWHIRRYSSGGFMEPFAVYAATLAVWAYSASIQFAKQQGELQGQRLVVPSQPAEVHDSESSHHASPLGSISSRGESAPGAWTGADEAPDPSFIHLDRPCDDEMVQTYLRHGDKMSAYMSRVGNISDRIAPLKIVQEGIRLLVGEPPASPTGPNGQRSPSGGQLAAPGRWGIEDSFAQVLKALAHTMDQSQP